MAFQVLSKTINRMSSKTTMNGSTFMSRGSAAVATLTENEDVKSLSSSGNFISGAQGDERVTSNFPFVCRVACRPVNTIYHTWCERSAAVRVGWGLRENVHAMDIIVV
jgi:hypothetical protein